MAHARNWRRLDTEHTRRMWERGYRVASLLGEPATSESGYRVPCDDYDCFAAVRWWPDGRIEARSIRFPSDGSAVAALGELGIEAA